MVEIGDLEADIREVGEVQEEQGEDKEEARENGEVFSSCGDAAVVVMSEITPLLDSAIHAVQNPPKMNIFSVSYPRSRSKVRIILLSLISCACLFSAGLLFEVFVLFVVLAFQFCVISTWFIQLLR